MKTLQFNSSLSLTPYFVVWTHPFASVFEKLKYPFTSFFFFFFSWIFSWIFIQDQRKKICINFWKWLLNTWNLYSLFSRAQTSSFLSFDHFSIHFLNCLRENSLSRLISAFVIGITFLFITLGKHPSISPPRLLLVLCPQYIKALQFIPARWRRWRQWC